MPEDEFAKVIWPANECVMYSFEEKKQCQRACMQSTRTLRLKLRIGIQPTSICYDLEVFMSKMSSVKRHLYLLTSLSWFEFKKTLKWPFYESENVYSAGCYVRRYRMYSIATQLPRATIMLAVRCLHPPHSKFTVMTSCRGLLRLVQPRARMRTTFIIHRAKNTLKSDGLIGHQPEFYSL